MKTMCFWELFQFSSQDSTVILDGAGEKAKIEDRLQGLVENPKKREICWDFFSPFKNDQKLFILQKIMP